MKSTKLTASKLTVAYSTTANKPILVVKSILVVAFKSLLDRPIGTKLSHEVCKGRVATLKAFGVSGRSDRLAYMGDVTTENQLSLFWE